MDPLYNDDVHIGIMQNLITQYVPLENESSANATAVAYWDITCYNAWDTRWPASCISVPEYINN